MALTVDEIDRRTKQAREAAETQAKQAKEKIAEAAKLSKEADDREGKIANEQKAITELRAEASRLERDAEIALGIRSTAPRRRGGGGRRAGGAFNEDAVVTYIRRAGEPVGAAALKTVAGDISSATLSNNLKRLVDAGVLRKQGEKRGTKYTSA